MELKTSLLLMLPELVFSVSGLVLLLMCAWMGDRAARLISILTAAVLGAGFAMVLPLAIGGASGPDTIAFFGQLRADAFASFAKLLIYLSGIAALMIAPKFFGRIGAMRGEYAVLILFATLGMSVMVSATDLVSLYIGLELNSLAAYVMAAFLREDDRSAEAGLKYFVLGSLASGILLFGMSLTYGFTGTTNFAGISAAMGTDLSTGALFGLIFVLAGLAFKISAVPFHMWTPDVYEGAPTPVTTFFATAPKVAAIALLTRVSISAFGSVATAWQQVVIIAALASIVWGALGAIGQSNLKRLLAYSSINNVGFILIGLAAATVAGVSGVLVYLVIYVAMSIGSFVAVLMLRDAEGAPLERVSDIAGLSRTRPILALCLAALMFSLAGIPPLFGFWGKFVVFQAAVEADMLALAAIGIAASVIGAFYYIKIVKVMYFDDPAGTATGEAETSQWVLLGLSALFISPLGYLLTPWLGQMADKAAAVLFATIG
ncbi:NADH-quinone oxidoreductase subunit NuoN [Alteriqipengyuania flavescens]|uniref:NADH-quinone oxidoreductase subunit NuoN n=1 Tax=Alteriqipengyuania flavescens TaxID=3053610 RepID=UPI0025B29AB4|nr:NADH-quinone oxidoreductase subunit NuoN [Alteriqipengyuania flavescens]WJY18150.1 NADH-quinone oxidoreductase subunit NuoN [Alteriqipengyuania flavescens]WJY24091.1 NADH-quinone oxidoreductase subunit NuoN [Alteriqipengyuania flavescens]